MKKSIILISWSSRGIWKEVAIVAKKNWMEVILHGRTESEKLQNLAKELDSDYIVWDITNKKVISEEIKKKVNKYWKIDILVNCAWIVKPKPFLECEKEDFYVEFDTNVIGTINFCQSVIPFMKEKKSWSIINIASIRWMSSMSSSRWTSYSMSKASIINLSASLAKEFWPEIRVNSVSPWFTLTDMSETWNDNVWAQAKNNSMKRPAEAKEIAETIVFLWSDKSSYITGQNIVVDWWYWAFGK